MTKVLLITISLQIIIKFRTKTKVIIKIKKSNFNDKSDKK